jgi:GAF domain-containing protein
MSQERASYGHRLPAQVTAELSVGGRALETTLRTLTAEGAQVLLDGAASAALAPGVAAVLGLVRPGGAESIRVDTEILWVRWDATDFRGRSCVALGLAYRAVSAEARRALETFSATIRPVVLAVGGLGADSVAALKPEFDLEVLPTGQSASDLIDREEIAAVLLGPELAGEAASRFLADVTQRFPSISTRFIVLAAGSGLARFQDFIDDDTIFFLTESPVDPEELLAIVRSAVTSWERSLHGPQAADLESTEQIARLRRILDLAQRLAVQNDTLAITELAAGAVRDVVSAERAYCLVYDVRDQVLRGREPGGEERIESAAAGIASFAVRTGLAQRVPHAAEDGRYDREADDPAGTGDERLLAVPVSDGSEGRVLAVLVAVRAASRPEFKAEDVRTLGVVARYVGAVLSRLALHAELERAAADAGTSTGRSATDLYREEALRHYVSAGEQGDVLRVSERWMSWTFRLVGLSATAAVLFATLASVHRYAAGVAVVRIDAGARGHVVAVLPGHYLPTLRPGQPLLVELNGFPNEPQHLTLESVGEEVVGREEAQRYLGSRVSADILPAGPVVLVQARLHSPRFVAQGHDYRYHDGMVGTAHVRVDSERLVTALVPRLKALFNE